MGFITCMQVHTKYSNTYLTTTFYFMQFLNKFNLKNYIRFYKHCTGQLKLGQIRNFLQRVLSLEYYEYFLEFNNDFKYFTCVDRKIK